MTHRIDVELTESEYDLLLFAVGAGCGVANAYGFASIDTVVTLTNNLFAGSPDFIPYVVKDGRIERATKQ